MVGWLDGRILRGCWEQVVALAAAACGECLSPQCVRCTGMRCMRRRGSTAKHHQTSAVSKGVTMPTVFGRHRHVYACESRVHTTIYHTIPCRLPVLLETPFTLFERLLLLRPRPARRAEPAAASAAAVPAAPAAAIRPVKGLRVRPRHDRSVHEPAALLSRPAVPAVEAALTLVLVAAVVHVPALVRAHAAAVAVAAIKVPPVAATPPLVHGCSKRTCGRARTTDALSCFQRQPRAPKQANANDGLKDQRVHRRGRWRTCQNRRPSPGQ
mmetsp:Transcript_100453/g.287571  ORF Transcript_100453/g.287571 Transcript_100453/m.287571 type:complete len:269 (+) Transcript_100453:1473-2279(+)